MTGQLSISVVIPTFRRSAILRATLDTLAEDARAWGGSVEVIVVCDGEDEETRRLAESYRTMPVIWVFHDENRGQAAARNTGAERATGDLLLFLDDDVEAAPGLLRGHAEAHKRANAQDPAADCVVRGRVVEAAVAPQSSPTGEFLEQGWKATLEEYEASVEPGREPSLADAQEMACLGLNHSMRRDLFARSGGFNPLLRYMDEDVEYGLRLYERGVRFLPTEATVLHRNNKNLVDYYRSCWDLGGACHSLRARKLSERSAQIRGLLRLDTGPKLQQITNRFFWHVREDAHGVADVLRGVTDRTGSRISFRLWHEVERLSRYWSAVQASGVSREQLRELPGEPVRVLMLHSIARPSNREEASYYLSPERWHLLLERMRDGGYRCADPKKLEDRDAVWETREVVLTFDDGYDDFYTEVFPLIAEHGLKPLVFLPLDWIGKWNGWDQDKPVRRRNLLSLEQIRELQRNGVRFGSHSMTHAFLPALGPEALRSEVNGSKARLEDLLGEEISAFAYPFGGATRRVRAEVIRAGYKVAFTTTEGLNVWQDPFAMLRSEFNDGVKPWTYAWKLRHGTGVRQSLRQELMPLRQVLPRELRGPFASARRDRSRTEPVL